MAQVDQDAFKRVYDLFLQNDSGGERHHLIGYFYGVMHRAGPTFTMDHAVSALDVMVESLEELKFQLQLKKFMMSDAFVAVQRIFVVYFEQDEENITLDQGVMGLLNSEDDIPKLVRFLEEDLGISIPDDRKAHLSVLDLRTLVEVVDKLLKAKGGA